MSGPQYANRPGQCLICGVAAIASINGAWFCPDHQGEVLVFQLEMLAMESGAPLEVLEIMTIHMLEELLGGDDADSNGAPG